MPRVENLGANVDEWNRIEDEHSSTYDVCRHCYEDLETDPNAHNQDLVPYNNNEPQGEDGWGGDLFHPSYEEEDYECAVCGKHLTEDDD